MPTEETNEATWDDVDWGDLELENTEPEPEPIKSSAEPPSPPPLPQEARLQEERVEPDSPEPDPIQQEEPASNDPPSEPKQPTHAVPSQIQSSSASVVITPESAATLDLTFDGNTTRVDLKSSLQVGRKSDNDLVIQDRYVSSYHASFTKRPDGIYEIRDLDSSGGTFVNGNAITTHELANGDRIEFASVVAIFQYVAGSHAVIDDDDFGGTLIHSIKDMKRALPATPKPATRARIVIAQDGTYALVPASGRINIGRLPHNNLLLDDLHVSGEHAKIVKTEDDEFNLVDLNSTCGTFVNGLEIENWNLQDGDQIRFGSIECVFEVENFS